MKPAPAAPGGSSSGDVRVLLRIPPCPFGTGCAILWAMRLGILIALLAVGTARAQDSAGSVARACQRALSALSKHGITSTFVAMDVKTGDVVASRRAQHLLVPASNMKVLTAAAGLLGPGPEHALLTDLLLHGEQRGSDLHGAVRLRGEGDPTLRAAHLLPALARRVHAKGIRRIRGDLLVDDRLFDQVFHGPAWPDNNPVKPYMAEVAALSLDQGTVRLRVSGGRRAGVPARVELLPPGGLTLRGSVTTCADRKQQAVWGDRKRDEDRMRIGGRCWVKTRDLLVPLAAHDPAMVFGRALKRALADEGVRVDGRVRRPESQEHRSGGHLVARVRTQVKDVLPVLLKGSQNHRAEMLFKHLGAVEARAGTFDGGAAAVRAILARAGVDLGPCVVADGSGLSRDNRVSADRLVAVMRAVWCSPARQTFAQALPYGGEPRSTMRKRLKKVGKRVRAKTGTLRDASALAGYVTTVSGRTIVFAVLTNGSKSGQVWRMREAQDAVVRALVRLGEGS